MSRSWGTIFVMVTFDRKYGKLKASYIMHFCTSAQYYSNNLKIAYLENVGKCRSRSRCITFAVMPCGDEYVTSYFMGIATCALSVTIYEIFSNSLKILKVWYWKWISTSRIRETELAFINYISIIYIYVYI